MVEHPSKTPEFGERVSGRVYRPRPGSYAVVSDDQGRIAVMRVAGKHFLPGGGAEPGESPEEALRREVREECGLEIAIGRHLGEATEFIHAGPQGDFEIRGTFFRAVFTREGATATAEADHILTWLEPAEAGRVLMRAGQRWAMAQYERQTEEERLSSDQSPTAYGL